MRVLLTRVIAVASSLFGSGLRGSSTTDGTVQIVGDTYLDVIAKIDQLPEWDGDTSIRSPIETVAGGSALNTAAQLAALLRTRRQRNQKRPFRSCILHSRVGSDLYGELVAERIREAGVTLAGRRAGGQGVCICLSGHRDRAFVSYKGTVADFSVQDLDLDVLLGSGTSHVHFSAYYDCSGLQEAVPRLMQRAKAERGASISIVPQTDSTDEWRGGLRELLPNIDVLICNQREAAAIAGVPLSGRRPTWAEMDEAVRRLQADGAPLVVVTLGADGALAASAEQWWFQPTQPRAVVDTTGAGDAFAAGFLFGWCGSRDVERGLVYGCACGAAAVGQIGGSSPLDADSINAGMRRDEVISVRDECDTFFNDCNDVLQESQRASSQAPWLPACTSVPLLARTSGHGMTRPRPSPFLRVRAAMA